MHGENVTGPQHSEAVGPHATGSFDGTAYQGLVIPKSDKILPQTGEKSNKTAEVAGIAIAAAAIGGLIGLLGLDRKKKRS